jgi:hypothetical protein
MVSRDKRMTNRGANKIPKTTLLVQYCFETSYQSGEDGKQRIPANSNDKVLPRCTGVQDVYDTKSEVGGDGRRKGKKSERDRERWKVVPACHVRSD